MGTGQRDQSGSRLRRVAPRPDFIWAKLLDGALRTAASGWRGGARVLRLARVERPRPLGSLERQSLALAVLGARDVAIARALELDADGVADRLTAVGQKLSATRGELLALGPLVASLSGQPCAPCVASCAGGAELSLAIDPELRARLSSVELETARMIAEGWSARQIAAAREVPTRFVEVHVSGLCARIGAFGPRAVALRLFGGEPQAPSRALALRLTGDARGREASGR